MPPTLEELRPVHDQVSNSINVSVAILPAAFYRLENTALKIFCIGSIKTKATSWQAWKFEEVNYHETFLLPCLPDVIFEFWIVPPVSEACSTYRDTCGRLAEQNFVNKKVNKTPEGPEGCRREGEMYATPQGREVHQIRAETQYYHQKQTVSLQLSVTESLFCVSMCPIMMLFYVFCWFVMPKFQF